MQTKIDVSLTDFVYAVVVAAAFQHIQLPLASLSNALILVCFLVIVDDWVLYHFEAAELDDTPATFAICLFLDLVVLLLWYAAATKAQEGASGLAAFALLLSLFYVATAFWELIFWRRTKTWIRLTFDVCCAVYIGVVVALIYNSIIRTRSWLLVVSLVPLMLMRVPVWRRLVLKERVSERLRSR